MTVPADTNTAPRVLHLTAWLPEGDGDTTGTFVREHVRAASRVSDGVLVHVKWGDASIRRTFSTEPLPNEAVPAVRLRVAPGRLAPLWLLVGIVRAWTRLGGRRRPDILHSHTLRTSVPATMLGRVLRRPVIATEHWTALLPGADDLTPRELHLAGRAYDRADLVLPVGPSLAAAIGDLAPEATIEVVQNAVDEATFRPALTGRTLPPRFVVVGKLIARKRFDVVLRALAMLHHTHPDVALDVVGDGPEAEALEHLATELDLGSSCTFRGALPKADVASILQAGTALVVSSTSETFSVVAAEALCCGIPVLTGRCGGPEHFVDEGSGFVIEPMNESMLAQYMATAVEQTWDAAAISAAAAKQFGLAAIAERLSAVYERVTAR